MTKSDEKLIAFVDILYSAARSCRIWFSHPNPSCRDLRFEYPRIISNTIFDNTSGSEFCVQTIFHKEGNFRRREEKNKLIEELKIKVKDKKKSIREHSFKYHKGKYDALLVLEKNLYGEYWNELNFYRNLKIGPSAKMVEHSNGREQAAMNLLEWILQNNAEWVDIKKEEDPQKVQEILSHTRSLLKRFSFTIWLEKHEGLHTRANEELEAIQKGNLSWESYREIISNLGYEDLSEDTKPNFETARIELKYFNR